MKPRAVFDCMVFLQGAARTTSPAAACFRLADDGFVELCLSPDVLTEVKEVLTRPYLQSKYKSLTPEHVERFLHKVESKAIRITNVPPVFSYPRDPKDEPYLNLAAAAGARYLVSRDKDLLDLMQEESFRQRFPDLTILDPVALLREFSTKPSGEDTAEGDRNRTESAG